jgi:hypothetical protein
MFVAILLLCLLLYVTASTVTSSIYRTLLWLLHGMMTVVPKHNFVGNIPLQFCNEGYRSIIINNYRGYHWTGQVIIIHYNHIHIYIYKSGQIIIIHKTEMFGYFGTMSLLNMIPVRENSDVVIIYPDKSTSWYSILLLNISIIFLVYSSVISLIHGFVWKLGTLNSNKS